MKIILIFFIIFLNISVFSQDGEFFYKILINRFENYSLSEDSDYIKYIIYDTIYNDLSKKFDLINYEDFSKQYLSNDYENILNKARLEHIDFLINGYYIHENNVSRIIIKITDIKSLELVYSNIILSTSTEEIYGSVLNDVENFVNIIFDYVNNKNSSDKKKSVEKTVLDSEIDNLIFIQSGLLYSNLYFYNQEKEVINDVDISSEKNSSVNFVSPTYNFEIYKSVNGNFHGFGLSMEFPIFFNLPNLFLNNKVSMSYNFGYRKKHFLKFGIEMTSVVFNKYASVLDFSVGTVFMGFGLLINYRYLVEKPSLFFDIGISLVPTIQYMKNGSETAVTPFNVVFNNLINNNNWFFPITFSHSFGFFLNKNLGLYLSHNIFGVIVDYKMKFLGNYYLDLGNEIGIGNRIIFGLTLKSHFN